MPTAQPMRVCSAALLDSRRVWFSPQCQRISTQMMSTSHIHMIRRSFSFSGSLRSVTMLNVPHCQVMSTSHIHLLRWYGSVFIRLGAAITTMSPGRCVLIVQSKGLLQGLPSVWVRCPCDVSTNIVMRHPFLWVRFPSHSSMNLVMPQRQSPTSIHRTMPSEMSMGNRLIRSICSVLCHTLRILFHLLPQLGIVLREFRPADPHPLVNFPYDFVPQARPS